MTQWTKVTSNSALELADRAELEGPARELLTPEMVPETYLERLQEEELWTEAITLMAHVLPLRQSIGWACLCDRSTDRKEDPRHDALIAATEQFVHEPTDDHRAAALDLAQRQPDESSGQMLAMAAGFSAGSVKMGDNPPVPVPTETIPGMVVGAVLVAASRVEPSDLEDTYRFFLRRARDIAADGSGRLSADDTS